jgi:sec-independent protein translocase protein TatC
MSKRRNKEESDEMSFLEHLEELRWHLVRSILAIVVLAVIAFVFKNIVFDKIIIAPSRPDFFTNRILCAFGQIVGVERLCINAEELELFNIRMSGQFSAHIMVSLIAGFIVAFPYVFWEIWQFLVPALYSNEKKYARGSVFFSSLLFMLGVLFGYYVIVPLSVHFLGGYQVSENVPNQINLVSYMSTVASIVLATGVIFELPILVFFLTKAGLVTPEFLKKYRRHSLVVILLLSAIITPPDVFSQILVAFPLIGLYEVGITISKRIVRQQEEEEEDEQQQESEQETSDYDDIDEDET